MFKATRKTEKKPKKLSLEEQITALGKDLAQEKLSNIRKTNALNQMGEELAKTKLHVIKLQGGNK